MKWSFFYLPGQKKADKIQSKVHPVFLPGLGCPGKCIFCNQALSTGRSYTVKDLQRIYDEVNSSLEQARKPFELAFYGGTFTCLPENWTEKFSKLAGKYSRTGLLTAVRASTRPDGVNSEILRLLKQNGFQLLELGAQTFCNPVLKRSGRRHNAQATIKAARLIKKAGINLGLQLLPGLPGHKGESFLKDIEITRRLKPDLVRIYPCLVLRDTILERLFLKGRFKPWNLPGTIRLLSLAVSRLWADGINIGRIGLTSQEELVDGLVAGPWDASLGMRVKALALYGKISVLAAAMGSNEQLELFLPTAKQGEIFGLKNELVNSYARLALARENIHFWNKDYALLRTIL